MMDGQVEEIEQLRQEWQQEIAALSEQQSQALTCKVRMSQFPPPTLIIYFIKWNFNISGRVCHEI